MIGFHVRDHMGPLFGIIGNSMDSLLHKKTDFENKCFTKTL